METAEFFAQPYVFTLGNRNTQSTENKHVIKRKLAVAPQLPIGDDVSLSSRCRRQRAL
jgi:hypothetical protein